MAKDKIDQILDLVSERSEIIQESISRIQSDINIPKDAKESLILVKAVEVELLDNLYNEIKLIKNS